MSDSPRFSILALAPSFAAGLWRPEHFLLGAAAKHVPVVWMDPPYTRTSIQQGGHAAYQKLTPPQGVRVYQPPRWLPHLYRPGVLRRQLFRWRCEQAIRCLPAQQRTPQVLSLWRPISPVSLPFGQFAITTYHSTDLYSEWGIPESTEIELLHAVNHTFASSSSLFEYCYPHTASCSNLPNGVDFDLFSSPQPVPADLASIPGPRLIYVGVIKKQLRLDLMADIAERLTGLSLVLVGPTSTAVSGDRDFARLERMHNVYLLGPKAVADLPGYLQHSDVGLLPYELTNYTNHISPMKLYEYLATGIPVVGSPIRPLVEQQHLVGLATTANEWIGAIQRSLGNQNRDEPAITRRRQAAHGLDWDALATQYLATLEKRLQESADRR